MEEKKQETLTASNKKVSLTDIREKSPKVNLAYQRDKDREKVKGVFRFYEVPNGELKFTYRKYKGDPIERFALKDGEICSIPLGVAKHLNKSGKYPVHAHAVDANGKPTYKLGKTVRRYGFQSLEFIDPEDFCTVDSSLITVESV